MRKAWKRTSRYVYCPMVTKKIGRRVTLMDRIRKRRIRREQPDLFMVTGYYAPVYPGK